MKIIKSFLHSIILRVILIIPHDCHTYLCRYFRFKLLEIPSNIQVNIHIFEFLVFCGRNKTVNVFYGVP